MLAILVILVLVALWAAVLLPPILRSRSASGNHGVSDFMDHLRHLGRGHHAQRSPMLGGPVLHGPVGAPRMAPRDARGPMGPMAPPMGSSMAYRPMPGGMSAMQRRRRNVLFGLAGALGVTFLLAFLSGSKMFWLLFLAALAAFGAYVYLLVQFKNQRRVQAPKRTFVTPVDVDEEESPKMGDNVVVLRRVVG